MGMPAKWTRGYRPDPAVLKLIEELRLGVEAGQIRALGVVIITPLLDVQGQTAGDIDEVRRRLLAAGLFQEAHRLLK